MLVIKIIGQNRLEDSVHLRTSFPSYHFRQQINTFQFRLTYSPLIYSLESFLNPKIHEDQIVRGRQTPLYEVEKYQNENLRF